MKLFIVLIAIALVSPSYQQTTEEVDSDIEAAIIQLEKDMIALNQDIDELSDDSEKIKAKLYGVESDVSYAELQENNINKLVKALGDIFNTVAQQVEEVQKEFDETDKTLKKVQATVREFINQKIDLKIDDAHTQAVRELGYSIDDTNFLITASTDAQVNFWQNGQFGGSLLEIDGPVTSFAVTPKNLLVTGSNLGRSVSVYNENYQLVKKIADKVDGLFKVIMDPDNGDQVFIGSNKKIVVLNVETDETVSTIETDLTGPVNGMALDLDDGELFTSCLFDNDIYAWNRADGTLKQKLTGHTRPVEALALDRRERLLVSSSQDGTIRVWDPLTLQLVRVYSEHTDSTLALAVRDGILYSASQDKTIKIWNLESPSTSSIITYTYTGRGHPTSLAINYKDQLVVGSSFGDVQYLSIKKLSINY